MVDLDLIFFFIFEVVLDDERLDQVEDDREIVKVVFLEVGVFFLSTLFVRVEREKASSGEVEGFVFVESLQDFRTKVFEVFVVVFLEQTIVFGIQNSYFGKSLYLEKQLLGFGGGEEEKLMGNGRLG